MQYVDENMQYVGTSKIGRLSAKKDKIYAQIRLPPQLTDTIGEVADIFETKHNGRRAFLLVTNQSMLDNNTVLQHDEKVVKLYHENDVESRLSNLESSIDEIKKLLFQNNSIFNPESIKNRKKRAPESGFEPESEPRQGSMIGHYTTRAT